MTMGCGTDMKVRKMAAGLFKTHCLAVMDEVKAKKQTVLITKRGKPIAKLVPADKDPDDIYGFFAGKGTIEGDLVAPALDPEEWGDLY